jgi:hypothetical protein
VFEVVERDYEGINLELRDELPQDFALFSQVDIAGPDPNGKGLFGYDNSPGKDVGNERLYDRIGGVNAITLVEQDGLGYGGVFLDSFFGYSAAPNGLSLAREIEPLFDRIFDRVRPDRGGRPVSEAELETLPDVQGFQCPGSDRATQVACAIWVLGNLIGSTVSHEIGHSLGLAKPAGSPDQYHNGPDEAANRLMDGDRPFAERAELDGQGPSRFCVCDYLYLRDILPTDEDEDIDGRPSCGGDDEDDYDISGSNECG